MRTEYDDARAAISESFSEIIALADDNDTPHIYLHTDDDYIDVTKVMCLSPSDCYEAQECADYNLADITADTIRDSIWSNKTSVPYHDVSISAVRMDDYDATDSMCIALFAYSDREDLGSAEDYHEFYGYLSSDLNTKPSNGCIFVHDDEDIATLSYLMDAKNMLNYTGRSVVENENHYEEAIISPYIAQEFPELEHIDEATFIEMARNQKPMFMTYGTELVGSSDILYVLTQKDRIVEVNPDSWNQFENAVATMDSPYAEKQAIAKLDVEPELLEDSEHVVDDELGELPF